MGDMAELAKEHEELMLDNPFAKFEDKADPLVPTATLQIYQHINDTYGRKDDVYVNRASAATMCPKRRQYQRKGEEGTPLTPRKIVNFLLGDLVEMATLFFVVEACVGPGKLYSEVDLGEVKGEVQIGDKLVRTYKQKTLTTKVPLSDGTELIVTCHADGFGKRNSDGQWELIECKSAANWGFQSFQSDGPDDYLRQAHTVMSSEECKERGIRQTRYFYMRKETGHLWDRLEFFNDGIWERTQAEFIAVQSDKEIPTPFQLIPELTGRSPNRKPTGRYVAQFPCTYCPYLAKCQGDYKLEWKEDQWGNQKPSYVFTPKVF